MASSRLNDLGTEPADGFTRIIQRDEFCYRQLQTIQQKPLCVWIQSSEDLCPCLNLSYYGDSGLQLRAVGLVNKHASCVEEDVPGINLLPSVMRLTTDTFATHS